jgi:two-component system NtrC family sensor kinase
MRGQRILAVIEVINNQEACAGSACHANPEEQRILGVLDIGISLEEMDQRLKRSAVMVIIGSCVFVLSICSLVGLFVHRFVRRPIKRLLGGINRVATGDFDHAIAITSSDEIGQLTVAYNEMTDKLRYHIQKLTEKQEQLYHSQKLASLGKMAAGIAHELNSPLTVILNDSSLLLRDFPVGSTEKEDLEVIVGEAKRCGEIIHNLLEFTRLVKPEKRLTNINDIVKESLELIKHLAVLNDIKITLDLAGKLPQVKIDGNQIKQVFLDIMSNAIQAMPDGGNLTITSNLSRESNLLEVSFSDTGCGISKDNINKIFQPFFTTKDAKSGTGLGLAICYEIVQKHDGKIEVTSTVGKSTTFFVKLPMTKADK